MNYVATEVIAYFNIWELEKEKRADHSLLWGEDHQGAGPQIEMPVDMLQE